MKGSEKTALINTKLHKYFFHIAKVSSMLVNLPCFNRVANLVKIASKTLTSGK